MTNRTTDIYCDGCRKYMHSLQPLEKVPAINYCDDCRRDGPPAQRPGVAGLNPPPTTPRPAPPPMPARSGANTVQICGLEHGPCRHACPVGKCQERGKAELLRLVKGVDDAEWLLQSMGMTPEMAKAMADGIITPDKIAEGDSHMVTPGIAHPANAVESLFDGGWIERYHIKGQRMLTRQSVAEHSWRMAALVYTVNRMAREALIWATLFHDVSERVTGDMPANVKRANPAVAAALHEISTAEEVRLHIRFDLTEQEQKLLGWADRFEGAMHCVDELDMGNRKIVATLLRYQQYYMDDKYILEDKQNEATRQLLVNYLNHRIKELL